MGPKRDTWSHSADELSETKIRTLATRVNRDAFASSPCSCRHPRLDVFCIRAWFAEYYCADARVISAAATAPAGWLECLLPRQPQQLEPNDAWEKDAAPVLAVLQRLKRKRGMTERWTVMGSTGASSAAAATSGRAA